MLSIDYGSLARKLGSFGNFVPSETEPRHNLPSPSILDETAHVALPGSPYHGLDRYAARKAVLAAQAAGMRCVVIPNELTVAMDLSGAEHRFESLATVSLQTLLDAS